jgi:hypothetical protein
MAEAFFQQIRNISVALTKFLSNKVEQEVDVILAKARITAKELQDMMMSRLRTGFIFLMTFIFFSVGLVFLFREIVGFNFTISFGIVTGLLLITGLISYFITGMKGGRNYGYREIHAKSIQGY